MQCARPERSKACSGARAQREPLETRTARRPRPLRVCASSDSRERPRKLVAAAFEPDDHVTTRVTLLADTSSSTGRQHDDCRWAK
eukprot:769109-Prymnesium_polylepis.1